MKKIIYIIFLFSFCLNAQTIKQSYASWKTQYDAFLNDNSYTEGTYRFTNGGGLQYQAGVITGSQSDMYFNGYWMVGSLTKAWQATGDNTYLDMALDTAEGSINGAPISVSYTHLTLPTIYSV